MPSVQLGDKEFKKLKDQGKLSDDVLHTYITACRFEDAHQRRIARIATNWRFYCAIDNELGLGQWPAGAAQRMIAERRPIFTFNLAKPIVDVISGGIMMVPFDPNYFPTESSVTSLTQIIKKIMYSDKEECDWHVPYKDLVDAGLIGEGWIKMGIDDEMSSLGRIRLSFCLTNSVLPDPMWVSTSSRDNQELIHKQWMMPGRIRDIWGDNSQELRNIVNEIERTGATYGAYSGAIPFEGAKGDWGSALEVISHYRMESEKYVQAYYIEDNGSQNPIPDLGDVKDKIDWLNQTYGQEQWDPYLVYEEERKKKVCYSHKICPRLSWDKPIEEKKKTEVQVGRLPFFAWSADRKNGQPLSIIDSIIDINTQINYHESTLTHKMQIEGGGGAQFADRSKFESDQAYDDYVENRNDPSKVFPTAPGAIDNGTPAKPVMISQFPQESYKHLEHIIGTLLPYVSKVKPTTRGMTEQAQQSGYLYQLMKVQSDQELYTIHFGLRQFWNEIYEAHLIQASITYGNEKVQRTFALNNGKDSITINERIRLNGGGVGIKNDISMLRFMRHKIIISEVQDTPTKKLQDLKVIQEYLGQIPPENIATRQYLLNLSAKSIDQFGEEDKELLTVIGEKELDLALEKVGAETATAKLNRLRAEAELAKFEQMQMQQPQMSAQGEGPPQQGAPQPGQEQVTPENSTPPQEVSIEPQAQGVM